MTSSPARVAMLAMSAKGKNKRQKTLFGKCRKLRPKWIIIPRHFYFASEQNQFQCFILFTFIFQRDLLSPYPNMVWYWESRPSRKHKENWPSKSTNQTSSKSSNQTSRKSTNQTSREPTNQTSRKSIRDLDSDLICIVRIWNICWSQRKALSY